MVIIAMVLFVLVAGAVAAIALQNPGMTVHLHVGAWQTPDLPVGLLLILAFILGACMFYLISVASAWQDARELRALHKRVTQLEQAVAVASANHAAPQDFGQQLPGPGKAAVIPIPGMPPSTPALSAPPDISDMPTMH